MIPVLAPIVLAVSWAIVDGSLPQVAAGGSLGEAELGASPTLTDISCIAHTLCTTAVKTQNQPGPTSYPLMEPSQRSPPLIQDNTLILDPTSTRKGHNIPVAGRSLHDHWTGISVDPYLDWKRTPASNGSNPNDCTPICSPVFTPPKNNLQWTPSIAGSPVRPTAILDGKPPASPLPKLSTFFVTVTRPPIIHTLLDITTLTQAITIVAPPPLPSPTPASNKDNEWFAPPDFDSLDCFNILKYGFGKSNLKVVQGIPAEASVTAFMPVPTGSMEWTNEMSALETFYPEGSINPGNSPQGGADFYANPLPALTRGQNVTFGYSVFVPLDFEPMRGGKLPGLYGGKMGCSGGDAALDCFSTRLMWRADYEGELYLYAPKDKQTAEVCNTPPRSICEADYGLSIGRGSFKFTPGQWTHVSQTVVLNTPGEQDGCFALDVNGERVMDLSGLYYRQKGSTNRSGDNENEGEDTNDSNAVDESGNAIGIDPQDSSGREVQNPGPGGELEELLGHVLIAPPRPASISRVNSSKPVTWKPPGRSPVFLAAHRELRQRIRRSGNLSPVRPYAPVVTQAARPVATTVGSQTTRMNLPMVAQAHTTERVQLSVESLGVNLITTNKTPGFSGIFFSTFFGGHTPNFATPRDQKIWFKDFSLVVND